MNLVILMGPPGCGKSTYALNYPDYVYINQDKQSKNYFNLFTHALSEKKDIIVDRMNFSKKERSKFIEPAKVLGYNTSIISIYENYSTCMERCGWRENHETIKNKTHAENALNFFFSHVERPTNDEADKIQYIYPKFIDKSCLIIDLDGTLCDCAHRLHHIKGEKKDWKSFFAGIEQDNVNTWCLDIIKKFSGHRIVFCTGRPVEHADSTVKWLDKYVDNYKLIMRPKKDFRKDFIVKEIILDYEILTRYKPYFIIDDNNDVCNMWQSRGYTTLQHRGKE